jgi:hypothetical protein
MSMSQLWGTDPHTVGSHPQEPPRVHAELNAALARAVEDELPRGVEVLLLPNERAALCDHIVSAVIEVLVASGIVSLRRETS